MKYETSLKERQIAQKIVNHYFKKDNKPMVLTDGQLDIFLAITDPYNKRIHIETTTQYGKSLVTAIAILWATATQGGNTVIVAPTETQARIIMSYIVEHVLDNSLFTKGLIDVSGIEKFKTERAKDSIVWSDGKSIRCYTVGATSTTGVSGRNIMGVFASRIVEDESNLTPNSHHSKVVRMLGGNVHNSKIVKIGNPFSKWDNETPHHFYKSSLNDNYKHIHIDYKQAIAEGRLTQEFVDEARSEMSSNDFKVLYEVEFPDNMGEARVFTEADIIFNNKQFTGYTFAGLDVSGAGKDDTIFTVATGHNDGMTLTYKDFIQGDLQQKADFVHQLCKQQKVNYLGIDVVGIGKGVSDILANKQDRTYEIREYIAGATPNNPLYANKKAELIYLLGAMMREGKIGKLDSIDIGSIRKDMLGLSERTLADRKKKTDDPTNSPDHLDSLLACLYAKQAVGAVNIEFF
jgi:hypothetical protein